MKPKYLLLAAFILISQSLHALPDSLNVAQWAKALSDKNDKEEIAYAQLDTGLIKKDSSFTFRFLNALEKLGKPGDNYFQARFNMIKARMVNYFNHTYAAGVRHDVINQIDSLITISLNEAYTTEDDYLIANISRSCSITANNKAFKVMYSQNYLALSEKLSLKIPPMSYQDIAGLLYEVREYDSCIKYMHKALEGWRKPPYKNPGYAIFCMNTIAEAFIQQKQYDSAFAYSRQELQATYQLDHIDPIAISIITGNMGQIFYELGNYDSARSLLALAYINSLPGTYYGEAGNALQWLAKVDLITGNNQKALTEVRDAFNMLKLWPNATGYLKNTFYTASDVFKALGIYDSAFYYNNLYNALNDSLEKEVTASSLSITRARLGDLNNRYKIQALNREKQAELTTRNMMISGVALVAFVALLLINRKRLKAKHEQEKAEQEKLLMQQQMVSAQEQLKMFTENIVEKSTLIEKLEQQQQTTSYNDEQQTIVKEIIHQSILTEEDWLQFKTLFEKAHPGFFDKLRAEVNDITLAEIRMATLTRLKLSTKQMADVLGISTNSIVKAKQRLRQRFNLPTNYEVETFIAKL